MPGVGWRRWKGCWGKGLELGWRNALKARLRHLDSVQQVTGAITVVTGLHIAGLQSMMDE